MTNTHELAQKLNDYYTGKRDYGYFAGNENLILIGKDEGDIDLLFGLFYLNFPQKNLYFTLDELGITEVENFEDFKKQLREKLEIPQTNEVQPIIFSDAVLKFAAGNIYRQLPYFVLPNEKEEFKTEEVTLTNLARQIQLLNQRIENLENSGVGY